MGTVRMFGYWMIGLAVFTAGLIALIGPKVSQVTWGDFDFSVKLAILGLIIVFISLWEKKEK